MPSKDQPTGLERELTQAIDELQQALQRASDATATIKGLLPRLSAAGSLLGEIEALVRAGRQHIGTASEGAGAEPAAPSRPTLVVPSRAPRPAPKRQSSPASTAPEPPPPEPGAPETEPPAAAAPSERQPVTEQPQQPEQEPPAAEPEEQGLVCFRLEFESRPGPLDLRTVDDAVSEHPAVRDVALLDYDGRRATLKVWITEDASPAQVQEALSERAPELFADQDVTIVALEDAA